jgi:alcohol dehydrogenase
MLTCGATAGYDPPEDIRFIWTFELKIVGSNGWKREDVLRLLELVQRGELHIPIERVYALDEAIDALTALEERRFFGKIIVAPDPALAA